MYGLKELVHASKASFSVQQPSKHPDFVAGEKPVLPVRYHIIDESLFSKFRFNRSLEMKSVTNDSLIIIMRIGCSKRKTWAK